MNGYIARAGQDFELYRKMAEKALAQVDDEGFFASPGPETNSLALIVKHIAGNLRSRWTDFLTTDGEKPDRHRDSEFVIEPGDTRASLMARWEAGWALVAREMAALSDQDLDTIVYVRWEPCTVLEAIQRQLCHAAYHVGQITLLARHYAPAWQSLTIPRGESEAFNERKRREAEAARRM